MIAQTKLPKMAATMRFESLANIAVLRLTFLAFMLAPSQALASLSSPKVEDSKIVVTGVKTTKAAIAKFLTDTLAKPKSGMQVGQYARFAQEICPKAVGFSQENRSQIESRMRGVALAAGLQVAQIGCVPNVYVIVVADGAHALEILQKKRSRLFGSISLPDRERISQFGGPAYAWKNIITVAASGKSASLKAASNTVPVYTASKLDVPTIRSSVQSNIKRSVQRSMTHSFLLLEEKALVNLSTVQVADYAAMRSYVEINNRKPMTAGNSSILALFDTKANHKPARKSISEMDLLLLSSFYRSPSDVSASMQRAAMLHRIMNELKAGVDE